MRFALGALLASCLLQAPARGICERGDYPWSTKCGGWQEQEMFDAIGPCWLLPVGPTGIRARITQGHPCYFTVKYVFKNSPAAGKVKAGDVIVGANGTILKRPHKFGRRNIYGWDGPMVDMANLIEDSQGKDGELELIVWPGGNKGEMKKVTVLIEPIGRFSPTYPYDCPRSDRLVTRLCDYLVSEYERDGGFKRQVHTHSHCVLALMASGDRKYEPLLKRIMSGYAKKRRDPSNGAGFQAWGSGYDGIVMGEYYMRYKDQSLIPAMKSLADYYLPAQEPAGGGSSHRPFPFIQQRIASGGPAGYGAMATPGGLFMLAMSLFKANGLEYPEIAYERLHQTYLRHASPERVSVGYGFACQQMAVIALEDGDRSRSPRGCGYEVPTGMKDIGKYKVVYPAPRSVDPKWGGGHVWVWNNEVNKAKAQGKEVFWWVKEEAETNLVFDISATDGKRYGSKDVRYVVRQATLPEPTRPYNTTGMCAQAPVGLGALAHLIGNEGIKPWNYLGVHAANSCALGYERWFDGHASAAIHQLWVALGAARADEAKARKFLDGIKWFLVMQQTHDGSYLVCPNRDRPTGCNTDPYYGPHNLATANAALILSLGRRQLQITGAPAGGKGPRSSGSPRSTGSGSRHIAKNKPVAAVPSVDTGLVAQYDAMLMERIVTALAAGDRPGFFLRSMRSRAELLGIENTDFLIVKTLRPSAQFKIKWKKLALDAKRTLALGLLREGTPKDHALVAFYSLAIGDRQMAEKHLAEAGRAADAVRAAFE